MSVPIELKVRVVTAVEELKVYIDDLKLYALQENITVETIEAKLSTIRNSYERCVGCAEDMSRYIRFPQVF